jgi:hypothetical protein
LCVAEIASRLKYTRPAMGHLAERYRDATRSGVYRATAAAIPRAAAGEAGAGTQVLILEGLDALAAEHPGDFQAVVSLLERIAAARRERGDPFFAVLIDPRRILPLPNLYREAPSA